MCWKKIRWQNNLKSATTKHCQSNWLYAEFFLSSFFIFYPLFEIWNTCNSENDIEIKKSERMREFWKSDSKRMWSLPYISDIPQFLHARMIDEYESFISHIPTNPVNNFIISNFTLRFELLCFTLNMAQTIKHNNSSKKYCKLTHNFGLKKNLLKSWWLYWVSKE